MAFTRPALLALTLILVAACGDSGSSPSGPTTTLDAFGANFVESAVADADDADLDNDDARCIATSILSGIDRGRLLALGVAEDGTAESGFLAGSEDLSPTEQGTVASAFEGCLDDPFEWLLPIRNDEDECFVDSIKEAVTFEQLLFSEQNEDVVGQAIVDAGAACFDG